MDEHTLTLREDVRKSLLESNEEILSSLDSVIKYWTTRCINLKNALEDEKRKNFQLQTELNLIKQQRR